MGENLPQLVALLKTLALRLLDEGDYDTFLEGSWLDPFPVLHDAPFWEPKVEEGNLLAGMTVLQVQSQTITLAHMVIRLGSHDQLALKCEPDPGFSPLQNSYLILIILGMDVFPLGALRRFEPWDIVDIGLIGLLYDMPDRTLSHAEQSSLVTKLERQHHQLGRALPIVCPEVDLVR